MRTIKATLKANKNGRLFCTVHQTYKVIRPPTSDCKVCWILYNNLHKQQVVEEEVNRVLDEVGGHS